MPKGYSCMDRKSVDVKKIMAEIIEKAEGISRAEDIPDFDDMPDEYTGRFREVNEKELKEELESVNREYYAEYDRAVDIGSPIRAKLGSMIRVRLAPILEKRNKWAAGVVRVLNQLSTRIAEMNSVLEDSEPERMKIQIEELEVRLFTAVRQMEVMNSRIAELEKALEKRVAADEDI